MFTRLSSLCRRSGSLWITSKQKRREERGPGEPSWVNKCKLCRPTVSSTDHTEGQAQWAKGKNEGYKQCQFLALHRTSNGLWTKKRPLHEKTMSGRPPHEVHLAPTGRYNYPIHSKLEYPDRVPLWWAAELQALREQDSPKSEGPDE